VWQTIARTGKPVLYADFQYGGSGGSWYITQLSSNRKIAMLVLLPHQHKDLISAVSCFRITGGGGSVAEFVAATEKARLKSTPSEGRYKTIVNEINFLSAEECVRRFRESKILAVMDQESKIAEPVMGIPVEYIPFSEVNAAWSLADNDEAVSIAEKWQKNALEVVGVPFENTCNFCGNVYGMKSVLKNHGRMRSR